MYSSLVFYIQNNYVLIDSAQGYLIFSKTLYSSIISKYELLLNSDTSKSNLKYIELRIKTDWRYIVLASKLGCWIHII